MVRKSTRISANTAGTSPARASTTTVTTKSPLESAAKRQKTAKGKKEVAIAAPESPINDDADLDSNHQPSPVKTPKSKRTACDAITSTTKKSATKKKTVLEVDEMAASIQDTDSATGMDDVVLENNETLQADISKETAVDSSCTVEDSMDGVENATPICESTNTAATKQSIEDKEPAVDHSAEPMEEESTVTQPIAISSVETTEPSPAKPIRQDDRDNSFSAYRLILGNLVIFTTPKDIKKLLTQNEISYRNVKKGPKWEYAIIAFDTEDHMEACRKKMQGMLYKKRVIEVSNANAPRTNKPMRRGDEITDDDQRTPDERLFDQVTPLWRLPYEQQLVQKQKTMTNILNKYTKEMINVSQPSSPHSKATRELLLQKAEVSPEVTLAEEAHQNIINQMSWVRKAKAAYNRGLLFQLNDIHPSPVTEGYRTKCEFSFGKDPNGEIAVGFLLGGFKDGTTSIMGPNKCVHVSDTAKKISTILEGLAETSKLPVYDRETKSGYWRLAQVRTPSTGKNMVFLQVALYDEATDAETSALAKAEKSRILPYINEQAEKLGISIENVLYQESSALFCGFKPSDSFEILQGSSTVTEKLFDYTFKISSDSFFQINTPATEVLYSIVKDLCLSSPVLRDFDQIEQTQDSATVDSTTKVEQNTEESESVSVTESEIPKTKDVTPLASSSPIDGSNTVLLDLCCGTGTIGITLASHFKKVVGVELVQEAIDNAIVNAQDNGVTNAVYLCGKVEEKIGEVFRNHVGPEDQVVAVLDPARVGVNGTVIAAIRACRHLKHVVYISCDAKQACSNFVELCRPTSKRYQGTPFRPVQGTTVDLFPHTMPCELVVSFARE
ncbi:hypothetical protein BDV3_000459 [Batrachochytrium dendrobatidis]|uniref:RRM domain-containing protein n=1 Tax=Batrachochytrium dendrobatidis (strain JEL423) TaxID=403673 RepID=A0A177WBM0_BATDL|nr:hypothetical protein BDEG_21494 [Batrachochytrium dendrobatidis JEL423]